MGGAKRVREYTDFYRMAASSELLVALFVRHLILYCQSLFVSLCCLVGEIVKLQQHLQLLREQYVRLQGRHAELERRYTREVAGSSNLGPDHFVSRLVNLVNDLYDKPLYR